VSIARVTDDVAERDAFSRHLAENPDHGRHRVVVAGDEVHPPHELTRSPAFPGGSVGRRRLLAFPLSSLTPTVELHHLVGH
jgi:hypothetical protein